MNILDSSGTLEFRFNGEVMFKLMPCLVLFISLVTI